ncbi:rod shape-determining protein MreC [Weissella uvarum]|uniref:rod shape-determining protein MreC n=1 Tax=Weissella uvarum TaxID=1479233 RepID=UPI001960311F|nr:rod shape-determining protein MreC [Weissella uvarum]MBM7617813.1 rod shape-determining protein MreC [Weissella uvarum]MCM0595808.1 rod shape-determining protein MreC [Weissella uvarum]
MKKLLTSRRLVVFVVVVIVTIGVLTFSSRARGSQEKPALPMRIASDVSTWVSEVVTSPVKAVGNSYNALTQMFDVYEENERLNKKVDQLAGVQVQLQTEQKENEALKKQLKIDKTMTDYRLVNASVISRSPNNWQSQLIINRGSNAGLKKHMSVMGAGGMIGRISEVDTTSAKVELLSDNSQTADRFAIRVTNGSKETVDGIVSKFDQTKNEIVMSKVTSKVKVKPGDPVTTSGLGGITPSGLFIGTVAKVEDSDYGLTRTIYVTPGADFNNTPAVSVAIPES